MSSSLRVAIGILIFSLFGFTVTSQEIYARLSYFWLFLILGNFVLSKIALRGIYLTRKARTEKGLVGDIFEESYEIKNSSRFPRIWIEVSDESEIPGSEGSRVLTYVAGQKIRSYVSRLRLTMRGVYSLGPTILRSGDPFGFFPISITYPVEETLTVYPRIFEIASFPSPLGLLPGGDSVRRRTQQITPNASTVREYSTGDPISRIHWKSTARRGRLIVKEFELDPLAEIWFFVDAQKRVHYAQSYDLDSDARNVVLGRKLERDLAPSTEEYVASITASLARYFLALDRSVALSVNGRHPERLAPDRGARQLGKIMESMALMRADGKLGFDAYVSNQARYLTRGSTVVLVTPSTDYKIAFAVNTLIRLGLRPVVVLLEAQSFGGTKGSESLMETIMASGAPAILVAEGDDLAGALSVSSRGQLPRSLFKAASLRNG